MADDADPMAAEFGTVAELDRRDRRAGRGLGYAIPAACRGQRAARPRLTGCWRGLTRPPGRCWPTPGPGLGGPDAYAAARTGSQAAAARARARRRPGAAASLFGLPVITADATALPLADDRADAAWSLGVLCTLPSRDAQLAMLRELRRVVRPGGRSASWCTSPPGCRWRTRPMATTSRPR